jgi:hypothetical protein
MRPVSFESRNRIRQSIKSGRRLCASRNIHDLTPLLVPSVKFEVAVEEHSQP